MKIRTLFHALVLLGVIGWATQGEVEKVNHAYFSTLVSSGREELLQLQNSVSDEVVFLEFSETEKEDFSHWPPAPLDYLTVLSALKPAQPSMLIFPDTLAWPDQKPVPYLQEFKAALLPFPQVLLGFTLSKNAEPLHEEGLVFAFTDLPKLQGENFASNHLPKTVQVVGVPNPEFRSAITLGFNAIEGEAAHPWVLAAFKDDRLVPSLMHQAITLHHRVPHRAQALTSGNQAAWTLRDAYYWPLEADAKLKFPQWVEVPKLNALDLLTPDLGRKSSEEIQQLLGSGKIVVLGQSQADGRSMAYEQASWIATLLAAPKLHALPNWSQWLLIVLALAISVWQATKSFGKAFHFGVLHMLLWITGALLAFKTAQIWWSPVPLMVAASSQILCILWPKRSKGAEPSQADLTDSESKDFESVPNSSEESTKVENQAKSEDKAKSEEKSHTKREKKTSAKR